MSDKNGAGMRELFIDELAEVHGGGDDPLRKVKEMIGDWNTTMACCEEGPQSCC